MNTNEIEQRLRGLYTKITGITDISLEQPLQNAPGWDSLRFAEFIIAFQNEFKIRMSPREIAALDRLSAALRILTEKMKS